MDSSSLVVKFPANEWPGWYISELNLTLSGAPTRPDFVDRISLCVDPDHADYACDSPVFRACMEGTERPLFALKFALREDLTDDLREEARVYCDTLQTLQGTAIPRCFGLYTGTGEGGQSIACLVLEHWGQCLDTPFELLAVDLKLQILDCLSAIHRKGLLHGDFAERNVLLYQGHVRIIDFDSTEPHDCQCNMSLQSGEKPEDMFAMYKSIECDELAEVCRSRLRFCPLIDV